MNPVPVKSQLHSFFTHLFLNFGGDVALGVVNDRDRVVASERTHAGALGTHGHNLFSTVHRMVKKAFRFCWLVINTSLFTISSPISSLWSSYHMKSAKYSVSQE